MPNQTKMLSTFLISEPIDFQLLPDHSKHLNSSDMQSFQKHVTARPILELLEDLTEKLGFLAGTFPS